MVQAIMKNPQPTEVANPGELAKWKDSPFNQQKMTIVLKNYQRLSVCVCVFCIERRIGICEYARCFRALSQMIARKWGYSLICCLFPMFRWLFAQYQPIGKGCSPLRTPNAIGWDPRSHKLPIRRGFLCDFYGRMVGKKCLESSRGTSWL